MPRTPNFQDSVQVNHVILNLKHTLYDFFVKYTEFPKKSIFKISYMHTSMKYKHFCPLWLVTVASLIYEYEYYFQKYFDIERTEYFIVK